MRKQTLTKQLWCNTLLEHIGSTPELACTIWEQHELFLGLRRPWRLHGPLLLQVVFLKERERDVEKVDTFGVSLACTWKDCDPYLFRLLLLLSAFVYPFMFFSNLSSRLLIGSISLGFYFFYNRENCESSKKR